MIDDDRYARLRQIEALLAAGHARDGLQAAEQALRASPFSADVLNLAGLCAATLGEYAQAEGFWLRSIAADPDSPRTLFNLGLVSEKLQRIVQAEQYYRRALALDPDSAAAHANLGALLMSTEQNKEAEQHCRRAIEIAPDHAAAHFNLGVLLTEARVGEAEHHFREVIRLDPRNAPAFFHLGVVLAGSDRHDEAEACYRKAAAITPGYAMTYNNLGLLLVKRRRYGEAEPCYHRAMLLDPAAAGVVSNLGLLLEATGRERGAGRCYRRAVAMQPALAVAHSNLGVLLSQDERKEEAEACLRRALNAEPDNPVPRLNLGCLLLGQGRFAQGWCHYEARLDPALPESYQNTTPPQAAFPRWQGESLEGRSLLVWPEQGLGDIVQFCRYLPLLKRRGASHITLVCQPTLLPLVETLAGVGTVLPFTGIEMPLAPHDYWTYPLSLPLHCHEERDIVPAALPYLRAAPERLAKWAPRLPQNGLRVGLAWKGNPQHPNDAERSLSDLAVLAPLWSVAGVSFVSLQKGGAENEARQPPAGQPLLALGHLLDDFGDTAAVVAQLDLVISVDTSVAHVAGALAIPCWVLLPHRRCDWRWLRARSDSPWYPDVMRLFRQARGGGWAPVVAAVRAALAEKAAQFAARRPRGGDPAPDRG